MMKNLILGLLLFTSTFVTSAEANRAVSISNPAFLGNYIIESGHMATSGTSMENHVQSCLRQDGTPAQVKFWAYANYIRLFSDDITSPCIAELHYVLSGFPTTSNGKITTVEPLKGDALGSYNDGGFIISQNLVATTGMFTVVQMTGQKMSDGKFYVSYSELHTNTHSGNDWLLTKIEMTLIPSP